MLPEKSEIAEGTLAEVARTFDLPNVSFGDSFADLRTKSFAVLRLKVALEKRFDISVDLVDIFTAKIVADLVDMVENIHGQPGRRVTL